MTGAEYVRFTTPRLEPVERFDYWRTWYSEATDSEMRLDPVGALPADFDSSAEVLRFGELSIAELHCGPAVGSWRQETTEAHDLFRIIVLMRALEGTGHWHNQDVLLGNGSAIVYARTGGWWRAPAGLHAMQVNVPRALLSTSNAAIERIVARQRLNITPTFGALVRPMLLGAAGNLPVLGTGRAEDLARLWLSAVTMLVRSLSDRDIAGAELAPARRVLAERFIEAHLGDPHLDPDAVAAALHVSRRTLYQSFAADGPGVAATIREHRLRRADALLRDPHQRHRPISEIAAEVGLPDGAHFSRLFRATYGLTPREVRAWRSDAVSTQS